MNEFRHINILEEIMTIDEIKIEVRKARAIFELHHNQISKTFFGNFPYGSCGSSSDILAEYLIEKGAQNVEYVYGERDNYSHGWLEIKGLIIDITGDQFEDGVEGVYISSDRSFHDQFSPLMRDDNPRVNAFLHGPYKKFKMLMQGRA